MESTPRTPRPLREFLKKIAEARTNRSPVSRGDRPTTRDQASQTGPELLAIVTTQGNPSPTTTVRRLPVEIGLCWRCGRPGHLRNVCCRGGILFCSRCGKIGTLSRECTCRALLPPIQREAVQPRLPPWAIYRR